MELGHILGPKAHWFFQHWSMSVVTRIPVHEQMRMLQRTCVRRWKSDKQMNRGLDSDMSTVIQCYAPGQGSALGANQAKKLL